MYPIHSLLRRFASTVLYAEPGVEIRIPPGTKQVDFHKEVWRQTKGLPLFELRVNAKTSAIAARKVSLRENEIARKLGAEDRRYTLIFGPELEVREADGTVTRAARLAVISGIFRYRGPLVEKLKSRGRDGAVAARKRRAPRRGMKREIR